MPWNYAKWKIWKEKKSMFRGESIWYYSSGWGPQIDSRPSDILVVPVMTTTTSQILALYLLDCIYWNWMEQIIISIGRHEMFPPIVQLRRINCLLWIFVIQCVPFIHWFYCENISTMHSCFLGRNWQEFTVWIRTILSDLRQFYYL